MTGIGAALRRVRPWRLMLLLVGVVALPWLAVSVAAVPTLSFYLAPERGARAAAVGGIVAAAALKVDRLGIPLAREPGVQAYLDAIVAENPGILCIALSDAAGRTLHAAPADDAAACTGSVREADGILVVSHALLRNGQPIGAVVVAQDGALPVEALRGLSRDLAIGLIVVLLVAAQAARALVTSRIAAPLRAVDAHLARIGRADLTACLVLEGTAAVPELAATANRLVRGLHDRCADLLAYAGEVREAAEDRAQAAQVAARMAAFRREVRLPPAAPQEMAVAPSGAAAQFGWFLLAAGGGAVATLAAGHGPQPVAAMLLVATLTGWAGQCLPPRQRRRAALGCAALALACSIAAADAFSLPLAAAGLVGAALGAAGAVLRAAAPDPAEVWPGALAGITAGAGLAGLALLQVGNGTAGLELAAACGDGLIAAAIVAAWLPAPSARQADATHESAGTALAMLPGGVFAGWLLGACGDGPAQDGARLLFAFAGCALLGRHLAAGVAIRQSALASVGRVALAGVGALAARAEAGSTLIALAAAFLLGAQGGSRPGWLAVPAFVAGWLLAAVAPVPMPLLLAGAAALPAAAGLLRLAWRLRPRAAPVADA